MSKIVIFRKTRNDFIFTAEYIQVIVDELVNRGHDVTAYDPKRRRIMDFSTRESKTVIPLAPKFEIPIIYIPLNFLALLFFAIKNKRNFDFAIYMYCRLEYIVLARFLFKIAPVNYILIFGNIFKRAINIIKVFPFFFEKSTLILVPSEEHRNNFVKFMENHLRLDLNIKTKHFPLPIPTIDKLRIISEEKIKDVWKKYNISEFDKVIFLGTNASQNEQHLEMINSLSELEQTGLIQTSEITLVFPLTYSESRSFEQDKNKIISYAKQKLKDYNCIFLTTYLPSEEYLALLKGSDIFINMRKTDQFAASVIEALYSGCVVISGKWLPYSDFITKHRLQLAEINNISELAGELEKILIELEKYKHKFRKNMDKVGLIYNNKSLVNQYCKIFQ
jgi:glycosyltransferase involved in cell wall biosynthesis